MENKAVIINKYDNVQKYIKRIREEYGNDKNNLYDYKTLDPIVLNLQRACEATIDIAMYIISTRKFRIPQTKKDAFVILEENAVISKELSTKMQNMVGFRNIAVHEYKQIDEDIVASVIENNLDDLLIFCKTILNMQR